MQALLVFCVCGGASVLLDLDHVLSLWWDGTPVTLENLAKYAGRPLHLPAFVVSCIVCIVCGALYDRWSVTHR